MGTNTSSFSGTAEVLQDLVHFTKLNKQTADALWERFSNKLNKFALTLQEYALMLNVSVSEARESFQAFDADSNGLVDAYQTIAGLVLLSSMKMIDKAKFLFRQYDFDHSLTLSMDEVIMMFQTLAFAARKVDARQPVAVPQHDHVKLAVAELEALVQEAFELAGVDHDGEIAQTDFLAFCFARPPPPVYNFTRYWQSLVRRVHIPGNALWEDPNFPGNGSSLYRDPLKPPPGCPPARVVQWLRPSEFCPGATRLFVGGKSGGDIKQGALSDAWFLNGLALITGNTRPHEHGVRQMFRRTGQEEQGRYCVRFFKASYPRLVYVDDRIPCDRVGQPLYARAGDPNELWPLLLEKAYAKLHGCYENICRGQTAYAIKDLTGRVVHEVALAEYADAAERAKAQVKAMVEEEARAAAEAADELAYQKVKARGKKTKPKADPEPEPAPKSDAAQSKSPLDVSGPDSRMLRELWDRLGHALKAGHLVCAQRKVVLAPDERADLLANRTYSVMDAKRVNAHRMVLVKNAWGLKEWAGAWATGSPLWHIYPDVAPALGYTAGQGGLVWIEWLDFCDAFSHVLLCASSFATTSVPKPLKGCLSKDPKDPPAVPTQRLLGAWTSRTAGGSWQWPGSWTRNPQFALIVKGATKAKVEVMISLTLHPDRRFTHDNGQLECIGDDGTVHWGDSAAEEAFVRAARDDSAPTDATNPLPRHYHRRRFARAPFRPPTLRKGETEVNDAIGFAVLRHRFNLGASFADRKWRLPDVDVVAKTEPLLAGARSVDRLLLLSPGMYVVVPVTARPKQIGQFVLTVGGSSAVTLRPCVQTDLKESWSIASPPATTSDNLSGAVAHSSDDREMDQTAVALLHLRGLVGKLRSRIQDLSQKKTILEGLLDQLR